MFLAFPLNDKPDWRHPPWMTILIILVNCVIFFGPQAWEEKAFEKASRYYFSSELPQLELPRYSEYLRKKDDPDLKMLATAIDKDIANKRFDRAYGVMSRDKEFLAKLDAGKIIASSDPNHFVWNEQHTRYKAMLGTSFTTRWSFIPAKLDPITAFTAVFLHGSLGHLLGNMVFLFVFGYTVEKTLGAGRYLAFYLIAGLGGSLGYTLGNWGSETSAIGASGAVSGLMAMYVMLYGRERIRFFYQFLFYFDYVTAPAIILLPVWIAHEFFQQWYGNEGVGYMAHAGGLITGALLILWHKYRHPDTKVVVNTGAPPDPTAADLARAQHLVKNLKIDEARAAFAQLTHTPSRRTDLYVLSQYFNLSRLKPASEDFHRAARLIFNLKGTDPDSVELVHESFKTYLQIAKPTVQFTPDQLAQLALRFGRDGHSEDAVRLAKLLARRAPQHAALPGALLAALNSLHKRGGKREEMRELLGELHTRFPQSAETRMAMELTSPKGTPA